MSPETKDQRVLHLTNVITMTEDMIRKKEAELETLRRMAQDAKTERNSLQNPFIGDMTERETEKHYFNEDPGP